MRTINITTVPGDTITLESDQSSDRHLWGRATTLRGVTVPVRGCQFTDSEHGEGWYHIEVVTPDRVHSAVASSASFAAERAMEKYHRAVGFGQL